MTLKQSISFVVAIFIMGIITALTGAAANKHLPFGWYIVWLIVSAAVLYIDILYLGWLINDEDQFN